MEEQEARVQGTETPRQEVDKEGVHAVAEDPCTEMQDHEEGDQWTEAEHKADAMPQRSGSIGLI